MSWNLPTDLLGPIFQHLSSSRADIANCGLVCSSWLHSARSLLFSRVYFTPQGGNLRRLATRLQGLNDIFRANPVLQTYVHQLFFSINFVTPEMDWGGVNTYLPPVLRSFTQIERLYLEEFVWQDMHPDIKNSFLAILANPYLTTLDLKNVTFTNLQQFSQLLHPGLKRLTLQCILKDSTVPSPTAAVVGPRCRLDYLGSRMKDEASSFVDWMIDKNSVLDISNLRSVHTWLSSAETERHIAKLLRHVGPSLEDFLFVSPLADRWDANNVSVVDVSRNIHLRTLQMIFEFKQIIVPYLKAFFQGAHGQLRTVTLVLYAWVWQPWFSWYDLDELLSEPKFDPLTKITVYLAPMHTRVGIYDVCDRLKREFPRLRQRGRISIELSPHLGI